MSTTDTLRGVLFDKDGTLIDFDATWLPACRQAAERLAAMAGDPSLADTLMDRGGWDAETRRWRPQSLLTSASNTEIVDFWRALAGIDDHEAVDRLVRDTFHEYAVGSPTSIKGIAALFADLSAMGFTLGVATMDDERTARATLRSLGLESWTSFICGADSGHGIKPGAGMLEAFCRHTGLAPSEVVMIGDSPHDLNMGRAANAGLVVGVLSGTHDETELSPLADHVVPDATALLELLAKSREAV